MSEKFLKIVVIVLFITTVGLAVTCMAGYNTYKERAVWADDIKESYDFKNKQLESEMKEFDTNLEQLQDKYYEEKLTKLLGTDKLSAIAKEQWRYAVTVNDKPLNQDFTYPGSKDVTIVLTETQPVERTLPKNIVKLGSIANGDKLDKFYDHMIIETTVPYEKEIKEAEGVVKVFYKFKKVPSGTIINLKLSAALMERMKFNNDMPEVIVK